MEIARLEYLKNHLVDEKASYSQVTSGSGHNKGKGEKQIELSKRQISKAVLQKKKELEAIKLSRRNMRNKRINNPSPKICIVGYTNAGKSTLMNMLGCLDTPTSGKYFLHGQDVSNMTDDEQSDVRNREIGFIFQGFNLIPSLTALENVELPLIYRGVGKRERAFRDRETAGWRRSR